ncbi:hypothetical protein HOLleu_44101 [Holothuria leucospilota]|uniref:Uncharacterized protein n=1 Tax=Holothuria leucospilota TaxID=206669 RepID=A0A9Q0Y914_HOLLE|nr:hypothetical protein HOLleu_44101 [Holothuria leucospilota]
MSKDKEKVMDEKFQFYNEKYLKKVANCVRHILKHGKNYITGDLKKTGKICASMKPNISLCYMIAAFILIFICTGIIFIMLILTNLIPPSIIVKLAKTW